jgi:membrane fusion protein (multidrug efflux system)
MPADTAPGPASQEKMSPAAAVPTGNPPPPGTSPGERRGRKRWIALTVLGVLIVLGGIVGVLYWLHARQFEKTDDAFVDGNLTQVSAQIAGRIQRVMVSDNQDVSAGEVIAEIDPMDFVTRVERAKAALAAAQARVATAQTAVALTRASTEATLVQAKAGIGQAEAMVTAAQSQLESAQADVTAAQAEASRREADVKRYDALDPRAVSQQQKDAARAAADAATAQLQASRKRVSAAEGEVAQAKARVEQAKGVYQGAQTAPQQIANVEAQVTTAQAAVKEMEAELRAAQEQLSYTRIVAPSSGRVTRKTVQPGQYVEAGQNLCTIVDPDVWVTANFKETQLTHMHTGQVVDVWVDAYPGKDFRGRVESIQAGTGARFSLMPPENATGNFVKVVQRVPVKIVLDDTGDRPLLGLGMSVEPRVHVAGDEGFPGAIGAGKAAGTGRTAGTNR